MQKLVLASANKHKIAEFKQVFKGYEIVPMSEYGYTEDIEENGKTFLENAIIKAKAVSLFLREKGIEIPVIADDSGLCVNSLNGEPGIYSARYAGGHDNKEANRALLIKKLANKKDKSAYFNCTIVMYMPNDDCIFTEGKTEGTIIDEERGDTSFGYDCIFLSNDLGKTFGEATSKEKNAVSHRGRAIKNILQEYKKYQEKHPKTDVKKDEWLRIFKFVVFSVSAGVIQIISFTILSLFVFKDSENLFGWSHLIALLLSVIWNFTFNRKYTFKSANNVPIAMLKVAAFYAVFTPATVFGGQALANIGWNEFLIEGLIMLLNFVTEFLYCRFVVYKNSINTKTKKIKEKGEK